MDMATCHFDGNPDMYGLGIRLGFYLQWLGLILADALGVHHEITGIRFTNTSFVVAEFLAILIQISQMTIEPLDIYIALLLCYGAYLFLLPLYLWRIMTRCDPRLDPTRWHVVQPGNFDNQLNYLLLIAVSSFQIWFWSVAAIREPVSCGYHAFIFVKVQLDNTGFRAANICLYSGLLVIATLSYIALATPRKAAEGLDDADTGSSGSEGSDSLVDNGTQSEDAESLVDSLVYDLSDGEPERTSRPRSKRYAS